MAFPLFAPRRALSQGGQLGNGVVTPPSNTRVASVVGRGALVRSHGRAREIYALLVWTAAVFLLLALASYAGDPTATSAALTQAADGVPALPPVVGANWVGPVGEACAHAIVMVIGVVAWAIPFELALLGIPLVRGQRSEATPARLAGDVLIFVVVSAMVQVGWATHVAFGKHVAAGLVGELFGELARSLFSTIGSFLVGFACLGLILIGRASFSFIALMRLLAFLGAHGAAFVVGATRNVADAWRTAREIERGNKDAARIANLPRIEMTPAITSATGGVGAYGDYALPRAAYTMPPAAEPAALSLGEALTAVTGDATPAPPPKRRARKKKERVETPPPSFVDVAGDDEDTSLDDSDDDANDADGNDADDDLRAIESAYEASPAPTAREAKRRGREPKEPSFPTIVDTSAALVREVDDVLEVPHVVRSAQIALKEVPVPFPTGTARGREAPSVPIPGPGITPPLDMSAELSPSAPPALALPALPVVTSTAAALTSPRVDKPARVIRRGDLDAPKAAFKLPPVDFLVPAKIDPSLAIDKEVLFKNAELLVKTLADYGVSGKVEDILPGPTVTTYEVSPAAGTKVSKVASLADDLALALAKKVRIVAPIPGKNRIGFELPNERRIAVNLRDLCEDRRFQTLDVSLPVVLGRDIVGNPVYADLASMPHVIVAGATGAGKSVGLNVMLTSLLYRRSPDDLRMLMIDPKVVELAPFDRIPHMLLPVVTDMKQAATALKWAVNEMERRYQLFADAGTKNIGTYNGWVQRVIAGEIKNPLPKQVLAKDPNGFIDAIKPGEGEAGTQPLPEKIPFIVIVVDEFADLMMQQGKEVEACVARLAQKARAAGMHVILATQRPSVDVITGMIKANFPTRIAFRVAQKVDSRTILDEQGAEHLLGNGDMLIKLNGTNETRRVQCPWVSEGEVQLVTDFLRAQGEPVYDENILKPTDEDGDGAPEEDAEQDAMYDDAVRIVADTRRCSTSWLQRKLGLGYNRAARIVETMERRGIVGPANGAKDREVLIATV